MTLEHRYIVATIYAAVGVVVLGLFYQMSQVRREIPMRVWLPSVVIFAPVFILFALGTFIHAYFAE